MSPCGAHHTQHCFCYSSLAVDFWFGLPLLCFDFYWTSERSTYGVNFLCTSFFTLVSSAVSHSWRRAPCVWISLKSVSFDQSVFLFRLHPITIDRLKTNNASVFFSGIETGMIKTGNASVFFSRIEIGKHLPGPMATDTKLFPRPNGYRCHIVSERMNQCPFSGCSNEHSRATWELHSTPLEKFPFYLFELRHCSWFTH